VIGGLLDPRPHQQRGRWPVDGLRRPPALAEGSRRHPQIAYQALCATRARSRRSSAHEFGNLGFTPGDALGASASVGALHDSDPDVLFGLQPSLPDGAIYGRAGWPLQFTGVKSGDHSNPHS